jgi:SCP-2 sterol transfer family protein
MTNAEPSTSPPAVAEYVNAKIAPRFHEQVRAAEQRLTAAQRELDDLRAAEGTIVWEVTGPPASVCYVNVANGVMTVSDRPAAEPLMSVSQSTADWGRFTGELAQANVFAGDPRRPMGRARMDRLRAIKGALRFVLTGLADGGSWSCTLYLGAGPRPAEPQTTITIPVDVVGKIQSGQLDPQMAFMQGQVKFAGDPGLAMQLGMALFM